MINNIKYYKRFLLLIILISGCNSYHDNATRALLNYLEKFDINYQKYECDNFPVNGKISCSYKELNNQIKVIECECSYIYNNSCHPVYLELE